jgi:hypothetical protein
MAFMKTLLIASVAAFVAAAPGYGAEPAAAEVAPAQAAPAPAMHEESGNTEVDVSGQDNGAVCGNGQKIACCNSGEDLIGANCLSIPIRELTRYSQWCKIPF